MGHYPNLRPQTSLDPMCGNPVPGMYPSGHNMPQPSEYGGSVIDEQVMRIGQLTDEVAKAFGELIGRLDKVLRPSQPSVAPGTLSQPANVIHSQLADNLADKANLLGNIADHIRSITARVEL